MLPFLNAKKISSVILARKGKPDLHDTKMEMDAPSESEGSDEDAALESAAEDLLNALDSRSIKGIAEALRAAHSICESYEDQEEGPEEPDYDGAA